VARRRLGARRGGRMARGQVVAAPHHSPCSDPLHRRPIRRR
jgi:hypothetical protein